MRKGRKEEGGRRKEGECVRWVRREGERDVREMCVWNFVNNNN